MLLKKSLIEDWNDTIVKMLRDSGICLCMNLVQRKLFRNFDTQAKIQSTFIFLTHA